MTDYYVQIRKGGVWHRKDGPRTTVCGVGLSRFGQFIVAGFDKWRWAGKSTEPREPLCKRCLRVEEKRK